MDPVGLYIFLGLFFAYLYLGLYLQWQVQKGRRDLYASMTPEQRERSGLDESWITTGRKKS